MRSLEAVRSLGALVEADGDDLMVGSGRMPAAGTAADGGPTVEIDCGNSGTTTRLLLGLLAGRGVRVRLHGDASLSSRPMARVVEPLRAMGADIRYLGREGRLPLEVRGRALTGRRHEMAVASAQVKSALLLAGLTAVGATEVAGGGRSRDHTERLLRAMGADLRGSDDDADLISVRPAGALHLPRLTVPGDPSSAVFLLAAAMTTSGSSVTVDDVMLNPTRIGWLPVLQRMNAAVDVRPGNAAGSERLGSLTAAASDLKACDIGGEEIPTLIDEIPILSVLASRAAGVTRIRDAADLRAKESDRIAVTAAGLRALGVEVVEHPDGLDVVGRPAGYLVDGPARVRTHGDHRIAMAFAVAGAASPHGVEIDDDGCVAVSYPGFFADLERLQDTAAPG